MKSKTRTSGAPRPFKAGLLAMAALLASCGGGGGAGGEQPLPQPPTTPACVALPQEAVVAQGPLSSSWNDVAIDASGRIWLAGYDRGVIGQTRTDPGGDSRALVRLLGPGGASLWDSGSRFDTPGTDVAEALAFDGSGRLLVAGRTSGALAGANAGQFDAFVARSPASDPALPWHVTQFGNARPQHPRAIRAAGDAVVVAGYDDEYIPSNYVEAWQDPFVARLRTDGASPAGLVLDWHQAFGTAAPDAVEGLATDAQGAVYVSGQSSGGSAVAGAFVRKLDAMGRVLWTARYTTSGADHIVALRRLADGSLLMAGSVFGSFRGATPLGQQDVFVARIDPADGHVLERWQFGTPQADWLTDMTVDAAGNLYLFGETQGAMAPGAVVAGGADLFVLKLTPAGAVLAARQWGTAGDESGGRIAVDACGRVVAVGSTLRDARRDAVLWHWRP